MCAAIRAWAEGRGFTVWPEVEGWDLVLTCERPTFLDVLTEVQPGQQLGIHAKLRAGCEVLAQARSMNRRPTWRMVAVPVASREFAEIAEALKIGVVVTSKHRGRELRSPIVVARPQMSSGELLRLPSIASRAILAGLPSPRVLSPWRDRALRFEVFARANDGRITVDDLKRHGFKRHWADRWLVRATGDDGRVVPGPLFNKRLGMYRLHPNPMHLPSYGYEDVREEIELAMAAEAARSSGS